MKRILTMALFISASVLLTSCKDQETKSLSQMETVIAVHDELMPKMTEIGVLREKLLDVIPDSLATQGQKSAIVELKNANDAMMQWMKDFGGDFDFEEITQGKPLSKEKKELLDTYQESVNTLRTTMLSALENGTSVFNDLKQ